MSLRHKVVLILGLIVVLYAGLDHVVQRTLLMRSFAALEELEGRKDVDRVVAAFEQEVGALDARCLDWATREDTLRYVATREAAYEKAYLGPASLAAHDLDLLFVLDARGMAVWSSIVDRGTGAELDLTRSLPKGGLAPSHPLLRREPGREREGLSGLFPTDHAPLIVSSRPIVADGLQGEVQGWLVMGRFVSDARLALIRERTAVDFALVEPPAGAADAEQAERWGRVASAPIDPATGRPVALLEPAGEHTLLGLAAVEDVRRAPGAMIQAELPRDITRKGTVAARYALLSTVAAGLLIMLVLLFVLSRTVLAPLAMLTRQAVHIRRTDDVSARLGLERKDEIGILSREIDAMLEELERSRRALAEHARAAGMSEIATGVLHNVGNVLNSVNVSAQLISDRATTLSSTDLARVMEQIVATSDDLVDFVNHHPKGRQLQPLLIGLSQQLSAQRDELVAESSSMNEGLEHIKELVRSQQSYAKGVTLLEDVEPASLVATAVGFCGAALHEPREVEVVRELDDVGPVELDRHRTTEILVNLIQNACQAVHESDTSAPRLTLSVRAAGEDRVCFEVADNGVGIPEENLARIFHHGFTTRPDGHGFGLHASANAATEMGGTLTAASDGPGRGATFTLDVPARQARQPLSRAS